ncbi:MAG: thiamine pyrophosphate-dependent dehydrogenase E1 component subunit alpha [Bryobacteraceae bacterium]
MAAVKPVKLAPSNLKDTSGADSEAGLALRALYYMVLMREVEDRLERKLYKQGKIVGGVYVGRGQEAIAVGAGLATTPDDILFPCHRDLALYFMRGVEPRRVVAQYMGRVGGLTRGRDGNMHMGDVNLKIAAIISAIGAAIPVAAGAALSLKYQGLPHATFVFFGDGATSRGDWHEGLNMAAVLKLPLVLICNNNMYAYSTPLDRQMACENVADRGPGYGVPAEVVDGNDVFAVYETVRRSAEHARSGLGPYLIECKTFRMTGHAAHDAGLYVPEHLWQEWAKKDPIERLERLMRSKGWAGQEVIDQVYKRIREEVDEAVEWAEKSPYPDPAELLDDVYGPEAR